MFDYNKRLVEVDEILNYLPTDDLLKIPEKVRKTIKENKDKEYFWKYDETKPLKEQKVSRDTIAFLSYLNMEYLLNQEQKEFMQQLHELNELKLEVPNEEKYGAEDLFSKNKTQQEVKETEKTQEQALVECKESFFVKVIRKIRRMFIRLNERYKRV